METTRALTKTGGITETGLKWIALVTMVMDHIHYFFGFTGMIPEWFSMVGRLGAPLFLFCLVEGFTHTHSRKKYFAKVYIPLRRHVRPAVLHGLRRHPGAARRVLPGERHDDHLRGAHGDLAGHRLAGTEKILPGLAAVILPWPGPSWQTSCLWPFPLWPRRWALPPTQSCPHGAPPGIAAGRCW